MTTDQITATLTTLNQAMTKAATPHSRPAVATSGCTDPGCTTCAKAGRR